MFSSIGETVRGDVLDLFAGSGALSIQALTRGAESCIFVDGARDAIKIIHQNTKNIEEDVEIYRTDFKRALKALSKRDKQMDLIYLDPPYNSRQYCAAYHLLENVARWEKPEVFGVAKKMDRTTLKSDYCTTNAVSAFEDLIFNIKAKYIVLSYNNMAEKGDERSNAKLSDNDIYRILNKKGKVKTFEQEYKAFSTGKSNLGKNAERLFVCRCF